MEICCEEPKVEHFLFLSQDKSLSPQAVSDSLLCRDKREIVQVEAPYIALSALVLADRTLQSWHQALHCMGDEGHIENV
jgi:hypothetical protein